MSKEKGPIERKYTPEQKLIAFMSLYNAARELKFAALKHKHPELSDEEIEKEVIKIFKYATS